MNESIPEDNLYSESTIPGIFLPAARRDSHAAEPSVEYGTGRISEWLIPTVLMLERRATAEVGMGTA
jgi:hypothetical protein